MANDGASFEGYVQFIYQILLRSHGKDIEVSRRTSVTDTRGNVYNIDVFYQFTVAGVRHRVAIECKDTRRPIARDDAIAFAGKIRDLPSTIGVFISRNGFQQGARKYLQDHGILYYTDDDLPQFGSVIATRLASVALPDEDAIGQPFWALMERKDGHLTGTWIGMPDWTAFPLFFSRSHAEIFREKAYQSMKDGVCVRGVEQPTLRLLLASFGSDPRGFVTVRPVERDGHVEFELEPWTADRLAAEYYLDGSFAVDQTFTERA